MLIYKMNLQITNSDFKIFSKQFPLIIYSDINLPLGYIKLFGNRFKYSICDNNNIWPIKDFVLIKTNNKNHFKIFYPEIKKFISFKNSILSAENGSNGSVFDLINFSKNPEFVYFYCCNLKQYIYINDKNELNVKEEGNKVLLKKSLIFQKLNNNNSIENKKVDKKNNIHVDNFDSSKPDFKILKYIN